jgi:hypothetical protein
MKYEDLDSILIPWSDENGLILLKEDEGEQVRMWMVKDPTEWEYFLIVSVDNGTLSIHGGDYYMHALTYSSEVGNLKQDLSNALTEIRSWMVENASILRSQWRESFEAICDSVLSCNSLEDYLVARIKDARRYFSEDEKVHLEILSSNIDEFGLGMSKDAEKALAAFKKRYGVE